MVTCSLQFDESSDDDLEKLMTPSSKKRLATPRVSLDSPMEEYVSPCFQVMLSCHQIIFLVCSIHA